MAKRYPDEVPVFESKRNGQHFTFRPALSSWTVADTCSVGEEVALSAMPYEPISDDDHMEFFGHMTPLTRAARELLAWVRQ